MMVLVLVPGSDETSKSEAVSSLTRKKTHLTLPAPHPEQLAESSYIIGHKYLPVTPPAHSSDPTS